MLGTDRDATDGSQLTAYSLRLSDSDSGPSAASRWPLARIIGSLYYPDSPYEFSVITRTVHGPLSTVPGTEGRKPETRNREPRTNQVIRLTAGHQAKVEEKPEVRKAGGVHYTPQHIVSYIVKNTIGRLIAGKTPAETARLAFRQQPPVEG